jgi:sigma-B regulation protein RsbU (phosphoserine phosphatase)
VLVVALVGAVFAAQLAAATPALGLSLLYVLPVAVAALWFGRLGGVLTGLLAAASFLAAAALVDEPELAAALLLPLLVLTGSGYGLGVLSERHEEMRSTVERQEGQLGELRAIQAALVPGPVPRRPGLELAACYVPAQHGVAGDFHLVAAGPGDATVVVIGDVMGKGLEAAQRASFVRTAFASFAPFSDDPVRLLQLANRSLIERAGTSPAFVTAACLVLKPAERSVDCALAGHPPPLLLDAAAELDCGAAGVPLGLELELDCDGSRAELREGSGVLVYTDGLLEARKAENGRRNGAEQFGGRRVRELLRGLSGEGPAAVVERLREEAESFAGGSLPDDLCLVALRATAPR